MTNLALLILPLLIAVLFGAGYQIYIRVRSLKCPNCTATFTKNRIANSIAHVYYCKCGYGIAPYLERGSSLYVKFLSLIFFPIRIYSKAKFRYKLHKQDLHLPSLKVPFLPQSFSLPFNFSLPRIIGIVFGIIVVYNLATASQLFHSLTLGFIPLLAFDPKGIIQKSSNCARCGAVVASSKNPHQHLDKIFCSENCFTVYKQNNTCTGCGMILDPKATKNSIANKGSFLYFCSTKCQDAFSSKNVKVPQEIQVVEKRRSFLKKAAIAGLVGAGLFVVGDFTGFRTAEASVQPPGSSQPTSVDTGYGMTQAFTAIVFQDTNGAAYVKEGNSGQLLVLTNNTTQAYANAVTSGVAGAATTTSGIQEAVSYCLGYDVVNNSTVPIINHTLGNGTVYIKNDVYTNTQRVAVPWPVRIVGEGFPNGGGYGGFQSGTIIQGSIDFYCEAEITNVAFNGVSNNTPITGPSSSAISFPGGRDAGKDLGGFTLQVDVSVQINVPNTQGYNGIYNGVHIHNCSWLNGGHGVALFVNQSTAGGSSNQPDNLWFLTVEECNFVNGYSAMVCFKNALGSGSNIGVRSRIENCTMHGAYGHTIACSDNIGGGGPPANSVSQVLMEGGGEASDFSYFIIAYVANSATYYPVFYNQGIPIIDRIDFGDGCFSGTGLTFPSNTGGVELWSTSGVVSNSYLHVVLAGGDSQFHNCTIHVAANGKYGPLIPNSGIILTFGGDNSLVDTIGLYDTPAPPQPNTGIWGATRVNPLRIKAGDVLLYNQSPAIPVNPPALGTSYQNIANNEDIEITLPITYSPTTSSAATFFAQVAPPFDNGTTEVPGTFVALPIQSVLANGPTGIIINYKFTVPAGFFWQINGSNATIGTASITPHY